MSKAWGQYMGQISFRNAVGLCAVLLGLLATGSLHAQAPSVMNLPGQFGVSNSGASTYSIPLVVPPGTAGMEPALSLEYSSQNGNGDLGIGWSLSGLPAIERCAPTVAQDTFKSGINYNANDRFCLNGKRLVAISGTYGASNTEYRTEVESFSKIVSYNTAGSGPQWFKVWTKSGQVMEFGNTADSRLMGGSNVRRWHVNRIADTAGNYMTVTYTNDAANGHAYPNRIDYTGNTSASLAPYNSVRFEYNLNRPDQVEQFYAGSSVRNRVLINNIKTYEGSNLVTDYRVAYTLGNTVRTTRIQSLAVCDAGGSCQPATSFTWPAFNDPISFSTTSWPMDIGVSSFPGEFNGDGLPDFLRSVWSDAITLSDRDAPAYVNYVMSTSPGNWETQTKQIGGYQAPPMINFTDYLIDLWLTPYSADFTGDGYTDGLIDHEGQYADLETGNPTYHYGPYRASSHANDKTGNLNIAQAGWGGVPLAARPFGDVNGDGRDDQLALHPSPNGAEVFMSDGNGYFTLGAVIPGLYSNSTVFAGDFNGDGCMDALAQGGVNTIFFACSSVPATVAVPNWISGNNKLVPGDYNGDGKTDVLVTHSTGATSLMLSTGVSLVSSGYTGPTGWAKYQISTGDFNGDGRSDLALIAASTAGGNYGPPTAHQIYLSTGSGFVSSQSISNPSGDKGTYVQDFNGDGAADLWITQYSGASNVQYTTSYQPMLLTSINNGLGTVTTFTYKRLNDNVASPYLAYVKGNTASYPEMDMIGAQYVVSQAVTSNGTGTNNTYYYQYKGARLHHQGRGFLGFQERIIRDEQTKIDTKITFRQDFPFIGQVATESKTYYPTGVVLSSSTNTYAADTLTPSVGGQRRFVKLTQSVATSRDLTNAIFPTITTNYSAYDTYGNPTTVVVSGSGGDTKTTANVYTNNATAWLLGRLTSTSTVHALSGQPSITRKASFAYNATTGLLTQEVIEPDVVALKLTTAYGRDSYGNITTITRSGADITTEVTTQAYDTKGRFVTGITNALSQTENFVRHAGLGVLTQHTDINGLVSTFSYDGFGNITRATDPDGRFRDTTYAFCSALGGTATACPTNGVIQVLNTPRRLGGALQSGPITRNFYDAFGRPLAEDIQGVGGVVIRTSYEYTALGLLKRSTRPYFEATGTPQWTTRTYDDLGRVIDEQYPDTSNTTFTYNGLTTTSTNDKNQLITTLRNAQNQVFRVTEPGSMISEYLYNAVGNLREAKDPGGNKIIHTMDTRGRVTQSVDPSLGTWTYQYTVLDQLKQQTDAKSQVTTLTYDKLGRATQVVAPALTSTFTYDTAVMGKGQLAMMETSQLNRRTHTYDMYGRPATTTLRVDNINYTYTSSYDLDGRLYTVQYPSGFTARYEYTADQRYLQYVKNHSGGTTLWTANARNAEGQYTQATQGNGVVVNRGFHAQTGRISTITAGPTNTVANYTYAFDTVGNLTSRIDATQSLTETFQYDTRNRMTQATIGAVTKTTSFNSVGNMLSKTRLGATTSNTYSYPLAGQPKPYAVSSITGVVNGITNPAFTYDNNGNLLTGAGRTVAWTSFNKVASITDGADKVEYLYDAEQQRLKQTISLNSVVSNTVVYLDDPASGASSEKHSAAGGTWLDSIFADGQRISMRTQTTSPAATTFQYFVHDHLGSVAVVTNQAGAVVQRLAYDAWGRRRQPNGTEDASGAITAPTTRGYTDHEHMDNVELINMNARIYDPEIGRFMSPDSIIPNVFQSQALNRYSYVYNNPGKYTDPSGHSPFGELLGFVFGNTPVGIAARFVIGSAYLFATDSDSDDGPPPHHRPGLASVVENLRGTAPIYNVSTRAPLADGYTEMGGSKFASGANTAAAEYASSEGMSWIDKAHLILNGASIALDASVVGSVVSWVPDVVDAGVSVFEGDWTGAGMSVGGMIPGIGNAANIAKMGRIAKKIPNPHGSRGGPTHRATIERRIEEMKSQGYEHTGGGSLPEELIRTPGGCKSCRRPDITMKGTDGDIYRENVGRSTTDGNPVARERRALDDIEAATGQRPGYTPYDR